MEYRIPLNKRQLDVSIRYNFGIRDSNSAREGGGRVWTGFITPRIGENERNTGTGV